MTPPPTVRDKTMGNDIKSIDAIKANIEAGEEELLPLELTERIINGENPLKVFRKYRGLTQMELSRKSGVGRHIIAKIETGRSDGSVKSIKALAETLDVYMVDIVS